MQDRRLSAVALKKTWAFEHNITCSFLCSDHLPMVFQNISQQSPALRCINNVPHSVMSLQRPFCNSKGPTVNCALSLRGPFCPFRPPCFGLWQYPSCQSSVPLLLKKNLFLRLVLLRKAFQYFGHLQFSSKYYQIFSLHLGPYQP